jgi:membrane protein DedA with SNARE-associated domain
VNLVAGAGRYRLGAFVAFGIVGRLAWTSAYLGLGYIGSGGLEPATDVLRSLTGLLVSIALLVTSGIGLRRSSARRAVRTPCE